MPIDTSIYQSGNPQAQNMQSGDPLSNAIRIAQIRNAIGNMNKGVGGTPGTTSALNQMAASGYRSTGAQ